MKFLHKKKYFNKVDKSQWKRERERERAWGKEETKMVITNTVLFSKLIMNRYKTAWK